jgi:ribosome-binding factor A
MKRQGRDRRVANVLPELARPDNRGVRRERVQSEIGRELATALAVLNDPRLLGLSITRVELSEDLRVARVLVRITVGEDDPARRKSAATALSRAAGRLRGEVGRALGLRYAPELRFRYDEGLDAAQRVDQLLAEIDGESS